MKKILKNKKFKELLYQMPNITRIVFSVCGGAILVFLFLSLLSYNALDPAWSHVGSRQEVSNVGGRTGAWLADILHLFFGMGSWWLVLVLIHELALFWWRRAKVIWQLRLLSYGFLLVFISAILAGWHLNAGREQALIAGGSIGLGLYQGLSQLLGAVITVLFLVALTLFVAVLVFELYTLALFKRLMKRLNKDKKVVKTKPQPKTPKPPTTDESFFEMVNENPLPVAGVEQYTTLSEFLHSSGLRDELLTKNTARHVNASIHKVNSNTAKPTPTQNIPQSNPSSFTPPIRREFGGQSKPAIHREVVSEIVVPVSVQETSPTVQVHHQHQTTNTQDDVLLSVSTPPIYDVTSDEVSAFDVTSEVVAPQRVSSSAEQVFGDVGRILDYPEDNKPSRHIIHGTVFDDSLVALADNALKLKEHEKQEILLHDDKNSEQEFMEVTGDTVPMPPTITLDTNNEQHDEHDEHDEYVDALSSNHHDGESADTTSEVVPVSPTKPTKSRAMDTLTYRMSLSPLPELSLLDKPDVNQQPSYNERELRQLSELLEIKLKEFNIKSEVMSAMVGPVVTRFEVELAAGVKASRVTGASQDLARSLSMASLRVVEVIPGKPYIGIEVPNKQREMVRLIELLDTPDYKNPDNQIGVAIGKDIGGNVVIADLAKAPHMLVAGTTGSGKSVFVNSILLSMLFKYTPDELKLVLIDPKQLELANYSDIPHLLTPVITDMTEATAALTWCVNEMERRYQLMSLLKVRKISEFNKKVVFAEKAGEPIFDPLWRADENVSIKTAPKLKPLPLIVIVADEFADMIMQLGKTAEEPIVRLAQKARAAGIHLVLATQRPTVNVVTGLIKANVPSRVALRVNSKVDSRTIIEEGGAENMLGNGDMMFIGPGENTPRRVHGAYVDDDEVNRVCDAWRERGSPDYIDLSNSYTFEGEGTGDGVSKGGDDEYYHQAVTFVMESRKVSISSIQRKLGIGYNRAARIVDMMEEAGLVSPMDNAGKRQILM